MDFLAKAANGFQPLDIFAKSSILNIRIASECAAEFFISVVMFPRWVFSFVYNHKHPSIGVLIKKCSESMQQFYGRTSMPKYNFNKVAKQL